MTGHNCLEYLRYRSHEWAETHGLACGPYERCFQEWWECVECGEKFTEDELVQMMGQRGGKG